MPFLCVRIHHKIFVLSIVACFCTYFIRVWHVICQMATILLIIYAFSYTFLIILCCKILLTSISNAVVCKLLSTEHISSLLGTFVDGFELVTLWKYGENWDQTDLAFLVIMNVLPIWSIFSAQWILKTVLEKTRKWTLWIDDWGHRLIMRASL